MAQHYRGRMTPRELLRDKVITFPASHGCSYFQVDQNHLVRLIRMPENRSIYIGDLDTTEEVLFVRKDGLRANYGSYTFSIPKEVLVNMPGIKVVCLEIREEHELLRYCCYTQDALKFGSLLSDQKSIAASHQLYLFVPFQYWCQVRTDLDAYDYLSETKENV
jgi:hypothetical protein